MSIQERILQYLEYKAITPYKFCKDLDFPMGYLNKRGAIGTDKYLKIIKYYTDLNPEWLLTGNSPMLKNGTNSVVVGNNNVTNTGNNNVTISNNGGNGNTTTNTATNNYGLTKQECQEQNAIVSGQNNQYITLLEKTNALLEKNVAILEENKALLQAENERLKAEIQSLKSVQNVAVNQFNQPSQTAQPRPSI